MTQSNYKLFLSIKFNIFNKFEAVPSSHGGLGLTICI